MDSPSIKKKEELKDGSWSDYEDQAYMKEILSLAFQTWNEVPGSYLELVLETDENISRPRGPVMLL